MDEEKPMVVTRNFSIYPQQEAMLIQFAKENGQTVSGGLRYILEDWQRMKTAELNERRPAVKSPSEGAGC